MESKDRVIYIHGVNPVLEAFKINGALKEIYILKNRLDKSKKLIELAEKQKIPIRIVDQSFLEKITRDSHQGIVAKVKPRKTISIEKAIELSQKSGESALFLILDLIEDPQNFGAILRVADAAGVHAVIYQERRSVGLVPSVWKSSAGAVWHINLVEVNNIKYAIKYLKEFGIRIIGADMSGDKIYWESELKSPLAILLGSESKGIRLTVRELCDEIVKIPMKGRIDSLNVSTAGAVLLFEVLRQRRLSV